MCGSLCAQMHVRLRLMCVVAVLFTVSHPCCGVCVSVAPCVCVCVWRWKYVVSGADALQDLEDQVVAFFPATWRLPQLEQTLSKVRLEAQVAANAARAASSPTPGATTPRSDSTPRRRWTPGDDDGDSDPPVLSPGARRPTKAMVRRMQDSHSSEIRDVMRMVTKLLVRAAQCVVLRLLARPLPAVHSVCVQQHPPLRPSPLCVPPPTSCCRRAGRHQAQRTAGRTGHDWT